MRIAICSSANGFVMELRDLIYALYNRIDIIIDCFNHGFQLLKSYGINPYDIVFLDLDLNTSTQLIMIEKLRTISPEVSIIGASSCIGSGILDANTRSLAKPVRTSELKNIIDSAAESISHAKTIRLRNHDGEHCLRLSDILFIESNNQNVVINTLQNSFSVRGNIRDYERDLSNDGFFRIHRGYIVALSRIKHILNSNVIMDDDTSLPVSRSRKTQLKNILFPLQNREMIHNI